MPDGDGGPADERVLVLAPTARDARLCCGLLAQAGVDARACPDVLALCGEMGAGAGTAVLTEEALGPDALRAIAAVLDRQPPWSDFPFLLLTGEGADSEAALRTLDALGNVTLLERPVRVATLTSAVRSALRGRRRQYQARDLLAETGRANEALRVADRQKDEFLAMLAHELRNPLAPIRNSLYVLRLGADRNPPLRDACGMMTRQVEHLVRMVDDLLDVSRVLRGKITLRLEMVDLAGVLSRAVETARPLLDAQRHELTVTVTPGPLRVRGDPIRLCQAFTNLLNNAAKYTEPGGRVAVTAGPDGGSVVVRVRDNGVGIAPDMLPRVFDLFAQADRSLDRAQGGLGLGLTLVRRLVEMHGGTVAGASDGPGHGSEFTVRLPAALGPAGGAPAADGGPALAAAPPRRILVVDDNRDAADSLAGVLATAAHEVRTVYDGPSALEAARAWPPEYVLLDIGLPGIDGYEVARRLRRAAGPTPVVLVAVTGYAHDDVRRRAREAGFDAHLPKPVDLQALDRLLTGAVAGWAGG